MTCTNCGEKLEFFITKRNGKEISIKKWRCNKCNPYDPTIEYYKYRKKVRAIMNENPNKIIILYECPCKGKRKIMHHPDYKKPFEIELVCFSCHWKAHEKMNPGFNTKDAEGNYYIRYPLCNTI